MRQVLVASHGNLTGEMTAPMEAAIVLATLFAIWKPLRLFAHWLVGSIDQARCRRLARESDEIRAFEHWVQVMRDASYVGTFTHLSGAYVRPLDPR